MNELYKKRIFHFHKIFLFWYLILLFILSRAVPGLGVMANSFYPLYAIDLFALHPGFLVVFTMIILLTRSLIGLFWGWLGDHFGYRIVYIDITHCGVNGYKNAPFLSGLFITHVRNMLHSYGGQESLCSSVPTASKS